MGKHYDFSHGIRNPYVDRLKKQITIRLDDEVIDYFKQMAAKSDISYQNLINLYLRKCVEEKKQIEVTFS